MRLKRVFKEDVAGNLLGENGSVLTKKMEAITGPSGTVITKADGSPLVEAHFTDEDGNTAQPVLIGVRVLHAGQAQHFSPRFIANGVQQGWLSMGQGKLTVHNYDGDDVVYFVTQAPGHYCDICGANLSGQDEAKLHVQVHTPEQFKANGSLSGYSVQNYYNCVKES